MAVADYALTAPVFPSANASPFFSLTGFQWPGVGGQPVIVICLHGADYRNIFLEGGDYRNVFLPDPPDDC